ncbi:MAG TPA: hypothetical protein VFC78_13485 [Tepidisphaeraceae bacterium]|nr:hypothetical protein [Tepidisphaeraceae bacterium]
MKTIIPDALRDRFLKPFGIDEAEVHYVARHPRQTAAVAMGDVTQTVALFAGWPIGKAGGFGLLLGGRLRDDDFKVTLAFKVPPDIAGDDAMNPPLQMLAALAEQFGMPIEIGKRVSKFIVSERIKVESLTSLKLPDIQNPNHVPVLSLYTAWPVTEGGQTYADCNLCFAIDLNEYREAIGQLPRTDTKARELERARNIKVMLGHNVQPIMQAVGVSFERAQATIRDRHSGTLQKNQGGTHRIYGVHWFEDGQIVFVQGDVSKLRKEEGKSVIEDVTADLVLALRDEVPAGAIERETSMEHILGLLALSFGVPVQCHPDFPPVMVYSGPWNGQKPIVHGFRGEIFCVSGGFHAAAGQCGLVWAFSPKLYLEWWKSLPGIGRRMI